VSETNKEARRQGLLVNILVAQHRCRNQQGSLHGFWPTFALPSSNLKTDFKRMSEINKEAAFQWKSGYLSYHEADLKVSGTIEENPFLVTFGQPLLLLKYYFVIFRGFSFALMLLLFGLFFFASLERQVRQIKDIQFT